MQETMLRAWQHSGTFKGQASLRTWLYRIATNACLDVLKKRSPRTLPVTISPAADLPTGTVFWRLRAAGTVTTSHRRGASTPSPRLGASSPPWV